MTSINYQIEMDDVSSRMSILQDRYQMADRDRRREMEAARSKINAAFNEKMRDNRNEYHELSRKLSDLRAQDAQQRANDDPDVGRKMVKRGPSRWGKPGTPVYGVVEIITRDSPMPGNKQWGLPKLGDKAIRLLKKDGKPGLMVERFFSLEMAEAQAKRDHEHYNNLNVEKGRDPLPTWEPFNLDRASVNWQFVGEERK